MGGRSRGDQHVEDRSSVACVLLATCALGAGAQPASSQEQAPLVEAIEVVNNQFLQTDTLLFYIQTKPGDRYDVRKLREDFRRLWDTGFLDDLQIDVVDGASGGKIVRFKVQERKRILIVDFRGSKQLPTKDIEEELKKREAQIRVDTFYDPAKARRVESILKEMLVLKGLPFATVRHEAKAMGSAGQQLSFIIDEGPKTRIKEIVFEGNKVFSDWRLRFRMKKLQPVGFFNLSWLSRQDELRRQQVAGGRGGAARRPRADRGPVPEPWLRHGAGGQPQDHVQRRQVGLLQEEAGQVDAARDPDHGGRSVPDGRAEVRGADRAQGALRAQLLQAQARGRLQRRQVQEGLREAARRLRQPRLLPVDGRHAAEARSRAQGGRRHGAHGGGQAVPAGASSCSPATTRRATR